RDGLKRSTLRAANQVNFVLEQGKTVALVGESGSGKSTIARMIAKLERPTSGEVRLDGKATPFRGRGIASYRHEVQMVFQDPFASLNPLHTIHHHLERPLRLHKRATTKEEVDTQVQLLLDRVNLVPARTVAARRPHELSGGQRQRVAIARALAPGARLDRKSTRLNSSHVSIAY